MYHNIRYLILSLIGIIQILMLIRAVVSWLPGADGLYDILCAVTEPIIYPVRALCDAVGLSFNLPIDIPFFLTFILLSLIEGIFS